MELNFYSELTDDTDHRHQQNDVDAAAFLDPRAFAGFDSVGKFPGASDGYLTISGSGHPFLSSSETFHTPSLGDEELEISSIPLDPADSALSSVAAHHVGVSHFADHAPGVVVPGNAVVGGDDPSDVNTPSGSLEHLGLGGVSQPGGAALLGSSLGMDLGHPIGSQFRSSSPMTIDVPWGDMGHALLAPNPLTTIDQSELSAQLGLGLVGGAMLQASPTSSLQDDDMNDFGRGVLVEPPASLSITPQPSSSSSSTSSSTTLAPGGRAGGAGGGGVKKGKPVSAYALFFRDTQAAIKGQNPSASFGEVSKIVASMWDTLGEEQKQVYKRKNEAAKREYLSTLGAYRAGHVSQAPIEVLDDPEPSPPSPLPLPIAPSSSSSRPSRVQHYNPEENTITNICTSNIILDIPQVSTRSRTGAKPPAPGPAPNPPLTVTKIIIRQTPSPSGGVTVTVATAAPPARQPPPLQPMHAVAPPPPRLQQMVHSPAPPPLQAKPQATPPTGGGGSMAPPPPLQIKMVPAMLQAASQMEQSAAVVAGGAQVEGEMEVEVSVTPGSGLTPPAGAGVCVRAGCVNPAVDNKEWDREYCSNECVATHCRDVFIAWCAIRGQNSTTVT